MSSREFRLTRRSALKTWASAGFAFPFVMKAHATAPPSETLYHASFGAAGMARSDIDSLTASPHVKLSRSPTSTNGTSDQIKERFPDVKVYQDWRELLDKEKKPQLGERLHARPHARLDHDAGHAARAARLHPETVDPDDLRGPPGRPRRAREIARHPDGDPDPFPRNSPDHRRDHPGRDDRQGQGSA